LCYWNQIEFSWWELILKLRWYTSYNPYNDWLGKENCNTQCDFDSYLTFAVIHHGLVKKVENYMVTYLSGPEDLMWDVTVRDVVGGALIGSPQRWGCTCNCKHSGDQVSRRWKWGLGFRNSTYLGLDHKLGFIGSGLGFQGTTRELSLLRA
jgi:hypothetical protein